MPRWLYGGAIVVYLAGTFGVGLADQFSASEFDVLEAMTHGASWPLILLRQLNIL